MSTTIEWTRRPGTKGETWNPVVGCTKVSQGCKHCYAKTIHDNRHKAFSAGKLQNVKQYAVPFEHVQLMPDRLTLPLKWKSPRTVFVNSVSDLFHADVPFSYIDQVFAVMALTPQHTYQILTKRPERMAEYFADRAYRTECIGIEAEHMGGLDRFQWHEDNSGNADPTWPLPLPNVWLGTSVEDQTTADARIPHLLRCPAVVRFLSCEPLLGAVNCGVIYKGTRDSDPWPPALGNGLHWVIAGGESGTKARPMHPAWARALRDQCKAAGVPFFFKQWGGWSPWIGYISGLVNSRKHPGDYRDTRGRHVRIVKPNGSAHTDGTMYIPGDAEMVERSGREKHDPLLDSVEHKAWPATGTPSPQVVARASARSAAAFPTPTA